jgi:hypothetical protein
MMRYVVLALGVLGALLAAALGIKWIGDYNAVKGAMDEVAQAGGDLTELTSLVRAAYVLLAAALLGVAGGVLALRGQGRPAAGLMLVGPVLAAILAPSSLVGSFLLVVAGGMALLVKPPAPAAG